MTPITVPDHPATRSFLGGEGKLAEQIARQLEQEIVAAGWPVGQHLGNEESLVKRFGVSRWVVREAIALTERDGMTQRLRGRSGGVAVAAPAGDVVAATMRNYLLFIGIRSQHLMAAFQVLEQLVFERVARRQDEACQVALRNLLREPATGADKFTLVLHTERAYQGLLQLAQDPPLHMFTLATSHLLISWSVVLHGNHASEPVGNGLASRSWQLRRGQISAMLARDANKAVALGRTLGREWLDLLQAKEQTLILSQDDLSLAEAQRMADQIAALTDPPRVSKRVDTLILQLQHRILVTGLKPGDPLASELELLQRYKVGRGVLREAVRTLERHGFVRATEGRHGGLKVGEPSPGQTVRAAVLYFTFLKPATEDLQELAQGIELAALKLCVRAEHSPAALERLEKALDQNTDTDAITLHALGRRYYRGLAATTNNPLFQLMMGILGSLYTLGDDKTSTDDPQIRAAWLDAARAVVSALRQGDFDCALSHHQRLRGMGKLFRFRRRSTDELLTTS